MESNTIHISTKQIIVAISALLVVTLCIFLLNTFDDKRKFEQFTQINMQINNSRYVTLLGKLSNNFDSNDTINLKRIKESLFNLNRDYIESNNTELILYRDSYYYIIDNYPIYKQQSLFDKKESLDLKSSKGINYLISKKNVNHEKLYELINEERYINCIVKVDDSSFLKASKYRN